MNSPSTEHSPLDEPIAESRTKFQGSLADFKGYFILRRNVLSDINVVTPERAKERTILPLKFAIQGLLIVAGIASAIGLVERVAFHTPHHLAFFAIRARSRLDVSRPRTS